MQKTQLILIDGIPGSGKSTTARWLADTLRNTGISAQCYLETDDPHPLHSFWSWDDGYCEQIEAPYDADLYTQRIISKCEVLVNRTLATDTVNVIECYPFQSAVKIHLKMGATNSEINEYFLRFQQAISPLNPVLIFFDPPNLDQTFKAICRERGTESAEYLVGAVVRSPYGRRRELQGWEGMLTFHNEYVELTRMFVSDWKFRKKICIPEAEQWENIREKILQICQ